MSKRNQRKRRQTRVKKTQTAKVVSAPEWINRMHQHFNQAGTYQADDVKRVLGDPNAKFQMDPANDVSLVCKIIDD